MNRIERAQVGGLQLRGSIQNALVDANERDPLENLGGPPAVRAPESGSPDRAGDFHASEGAGDPIGAAPQK